MICILSSTFLQAALDTKHKVGPAADKIHLIHFNDVYNIEPRDQKPGEKILLKQIKNKIFSHYFVQKVELLDFALQSSLTNILIP